MPFERIHFPTALHTLHCTYIRVANLHTKALNAEANERKYKTRTPRAEKLLTYGMQTTIALNFIDQQAITSLQFLRFIS